MFAAAAAAVLVTMGLVLVRAIKGPSVYDRILATSNFGTLTVVLIAIVGFLSGRPEFLDIALVYALINFIGAIAVSKFVQFGGVAHPLGKDDPGDI